MRIALRTGGGRGDYELAGSQGDLSASSLFDRQITYEITPQIMIPGRSFACLRNGKPRIRLNEGHRSYTTHFYALLASILLLPKPIRELKTTTRSVDLVRYESYCITAIPVDVGRMDGSSVVLRPTALLLENANHQRETIDFVDRFARITAIWSAAEGKDSPLAGLLRHHQASVLTVDPDYRNIEQAAQSIAQFVKTELDPLDTLEASFGLSSDGSPKSQKPDEATDGFGVDDQSTPLEAQLENVKKWREVASRGYAAQQFRTNVTKSYDFRCLFSGQRLPKTDATLSVGVDAAHILPWSTHGINAISNGLCLNKSCHWALDAGVLKFFYDPAITQYVIEVPGRVKAAASKTDFDMGYFESLAGPVPQCRLPKNSDGWPSPAYLAELNAVIYPDG